MTLSSLTLASLWRAFRHIDHRCCAAGRHADVAVGTAGRAVHWHLAVRRRHNQFGVLQGGMLTSPSGVLGGQFGMGRVPSMGLGNLDSMELPDTVCFLAPIVAAAVWDLEELIAPCVCHNSVRKIVHKALSNSARAVWLHLVAVIGSNSSPGVGKKADVLAIHCCNRRAHSTPTQRPQCCTTCRRSEQAAPAAGRLRRPLRARRRRCQRPAARAAARAAAARATPTA